MKYSKRVREEAALICAIAASNPREWYSTIEISLGLYDGPSRDDRSHDLAVFAYKEALRGRGPLLRMEDRSAIDAEAESMIRSGWSPK